MTKKELEDKLKNIQKDKYIYQRYDGRIYKFLVGDHYILDVNTGMNVAESILLGKISENIIDLIEVGDYVNGILVTGKESTLLYTEIKGIDRSGYHIPISQYGDGIKSIVTKEQFSSVEYRLEEGDK